MLAGVFVLLNAAALLSSSFYSLWTGVFFWLPVIDPSPTHGLVFAIGAIIGLILVIGSILMLLGYGTIGSIVVFPLAVLSLIIGGGFVAGFVLGVLGGILTISSHQDIVTFHTLSSLTFCRECGARIPRTSRYCPECGNDLSPTETRAY